VALNTLNSEQLKAATAKQGHNLVIASAGTGKTSTIVGRIAHLLYSGIDPKKILLLTFTNKAAGEMLARLERFFPKEIVSQIESGTFHAVCYRWLKARDNKVSLKQPSELKTLFKSIYEEFDFSGDELQAFSPLYLYELYSLYQNASVDTFDKWFLESYPEHECFVDKYLLVIEKFEEEKREYGFASFNDLLLYTIEYLSTEDLYFEEILVDEYQDTNTLQGVLIDAMRPKSLFCVGDYDQSIYAFNGANIENISTFTTRYKDADLFSLITNYRSTASILELANRVIEYNPRIYPKELKVGCDKQDIPPRLMIYNELFEQYHAIAHAIHSSNVPHNDIAVIFRNNSSADGVEACLRELAIPCKRKGGTSFFDTKEVKFLLDVLSLYSNPKDMMAFLHVFEYAKGVGPAVAKDFFLSLVYLGEGNLLKGVLSPSINELPKKNTLTTNSLFEGDDEMKNDFKKSNHPLYSHQKADGDNMKFFENIKEYYNQIQKQKSPSHMVGKLMKSPLYESVVELLSLQRSRLKNGEIEENRYIQAKERILQKAMLLYELSKNYNEIDRFLNAMILGAGELTQGDGINLLTVHASKGLEFTDVYVVDLMDGRFPNTKLMSRGGELEEERRLFYVAVTRAKEKLNLSFASYDKVKKTEFKPSQFLFEAKMLKEEDYSLGA
jgi:DNA helicase II / ATP-dependent DNA helicase PcrA